MSNNKPLLLDGAFGTYFMSCFDIKYPCELANVLDRKKVTQIHKEYIAAGSNLILTNTFYANRFNKAIPDDQLTQVITQGYHIAKKAAGDKVVVGASIGPIAYLDNNDEEIPQKERYSALKQVVDSFLSVGADVFVFETWADTRLLRDIITYIKSKHENAFIICSFAVMQKGFTREGQSLESLFADADTLCCDVLGLNCACGPTHMRNLIERVSQITKKPLLAMPNAGYPYIENGRTIYPAGIQYFGKAALRFEKAGVKFIGGCCGTTPQHISAMKKALSAEKQKAVKKQKHFTYTAHSKGNFAKPVSVELDPPLKGSVASIKKKAKILADAGVSMITLADSPLSRPKANSIMIAKVLQDHTGIPVMPHLCCRDRNTLALHSDIIGSYALGIRNILCVTGDPVSAGVLDEVKSVFDMNSIGLLSLVGSLNETMFHKEEITLTAAFDPGRKNLDVEAKRIQKKFDAGARNFYSQPVFSKKIAENFANIVMPEGAKKYLGIMPPVSLRNALFLANEVPGIHIDEDFTNMFAEDMSREQAESVSVEWAVNMIKEYEEAFDGLYFVAPFNRVRIIERILKQL